MWKLIFVLSSLFSSSVVAGEASGQLRVGITITRMGTSSVVGRKAAAVSLAEPEASVPLPTEKPAAIVSRDSASSAR